MGMHQKVEKAAYKRLAKNDVPNICIHFSSKQKKKNLENYKTYIKRKTILFVQYVSSQ